MKYYVNTLLHYSAVIIRDSLKNILKHESIFMDGTLVDYSI